MTVEVALLHGEWRQNYMYPMRFSWRSIWVAAQNWQNVTQQQSPRMPPYNAYIHGNITVNQDQGPGYTVDIIVLCSMQGLDLGSISKFSVI